MNYAKKYLLLCLFFFCSKSFAIENKILRVCVSGGFFPFESKSSQGEWVGFDVNMLKDFSTHIQAELQFIDIRWDGIVPALLSRKCDFIAGGMSITLERKKVVAFTNPVLKNAISILANKRDIFHEESLQDLDKQKYTLAVRSGTSADAYLNKYPPKHLIILKFDDNPTLINALLTHKANAIAQDKTLLLPLLKVHSVNLRFLKTPILEEDIALAARKEDIILVLEFNQFLKEWKKSGKYEQNMKKFFN